MRGYNNNDWRRNGPPPPWQQQRRNSNNSYRRSRSRSYSSRSRSRSSSRSSSGSSSRRSRRSYSDDDDESTRSRSSAASASSSSDSSSDESTNNSNDNEPSNALTKDQRTVFVSQLVMRATQKELKRYFTKKVGCHVNEVILLRDKRTGRHKGCAYVELGRLEDVPKAVAISGIPPDFQPFPMLVKASEAEKNYTIPTQATLTASMMGARTSTSTTTTTAANILGPNGKLVEAQKVYVGNLDPSVTHEQLYKVFSKLGPLEKVAIQMDPTTGLSRGFAFLSFREAKNAYLAIQTMSGQMLGGRAL